MNPLTSISSLPFLVVHKLGNCGGSPGMSISAGNSNAPSLFSRMGVEPPGR